MTYNVFAGTLSLTQSINPFSQRLRSSDGTDYDIPHTNTKSGLGRTSVLDQWPVALEQSVTISPRRH